MAEASKQELLDALGLIPGAYNNWINSEEIEKKVSSLDSTLKAYAGEHRKLWLRAHGRMTTAIEALSQFRGVKRRMELIASASGISVYDDFAHHPTAIRMTLEGLRRKVGNARILVALEPRSNTMRAGVHADELGPALMAADKVWLKIGKGIDWDPLVALAPLEGRCKIVTRVDDMLQQMSGHLTEGDHVVFMSNGGFEAAPRRLSESLGEFLETA